MKTKKIFFSLMTVVTVITTLSLTSCEKKDNSIIDPTTNYELSGSITGTKTLEAEKTYTLKGPVLVEDGGVLTIPAGTTIKAPKGFSYYILVLKGGKINVNGTAEKPVIMTADKENAGSGYWGGLIINGKAPLSGATTGTTEINSAYSYGGTDVADNSGTIKYLIIKYAGARSSADVEHNGLTLNGVGNGTIIENIYILASADDAIEFFGGSVNVKNILAVNPDDDMFDFTQGYSGTLENAYGIWDTAYASTESDPRGVEADGNLDGLTPDQAGQSNFKINNMTIDLKLAPNATDKTKQMLNVLKIRRGAKIVATNALVKGTGTAVNIVDFTDGKGSGDATSVVNITNSLTNPPAEANLVKGTGVVNFQQNNTGCSSSQFTWTGYKGF